MRKLLILALIAVAALVVMGVEYGIQWTSTPVPVNVNITVYQWADITENLNTEDVIIYDHVSVDHSLGSITVDSNYDVSVSVVDNSVLPSGLSIEYSYDGSNWGSLSQPSSEDFTLYLRLYGTVNKDADPGEDYKVDLTITFAPTWQPSGS